MNLKSATAYYRKTQLQRKSWELYVAMFLSTVVVYAKSDRPGGAEFVPFIKIYIRCKRFQRFKRE